MGWLMADGPLTFITATSMEFRPASDATTALHTNSSEDLQPNEAINKRQRAAPPTVLSASVKPSLPYMNRWRHSSAGGHSSAIGQGAGSLLQEWSQDAGRGHKFKQWRNKSSVREGGRGRPSKSSPWNRFSSRTESPETNHSRVQAVKPLTLEQHQDNEAMPSHLKSVPHSSSLVDPPQRTELRTTAHYSPRSPGASSLTAIPLMTTPYVPGSNAAFKPSSDPTSPSTPQAVVPPKTESPEQLPKSDSTKPAPISSMISISPSASLVQGFTPSAKRRKLDHIPESSTKVKTEEIEPFVSTQQSHSQSYATTGIKIEKRSPSPPPRRLVRESCSFYPLPNDCKKTNPEYKKNRQAFFAREYNILKCLGLKRTKVIFRDDGMVIEWSSNIPVWSDTLHPEPSNLSSVIDQALHANGNSLPGRRKSTTPQKSSSHTIGPVVAEDSTSSPQATSAVRVNSPPSKLAGQKPPSISSILPRRPLPPSVPQATISNENVKIAAPTTPIANMRVDHPEEIQPELEQVNTNSTDRNNDRSMSASTSTNISSACATAVTGNTRAWSAEELRRVEPMAVDYLQRYLRAFDANRSSLQNAYSEDALFSYRMTLVSPSSSTSQSSSFISYRLPQITSALSSILPLYKFCLRDTAVHYDVVSLDAQAGGGILLTAHGALACADANAELADKSEYDHVVAVDQSFVLQVNNSENVEESPEGVGRASGMEATEMQACWPLVAVSHHMVVKNLDARSGRLKYPLPIASISSEHFPWLAP